jgi:hypothetical protein
MAPEASGGTSLGMVSMSSGKVSPRMRDHPRRGSFCLAFMYLSTARVSVQMTCTVTNILRRERLKGRIASPGRIDQPDYAFSLAACVQGKTFESKKGLGAKKQIFGRQNKKNGEQKNTLDARIAKMTHDQIPNASLGRRAG